MPTTIPECPKDIRRDDGWVKPTRQRPTCENQTCDEVWDRSSHIFISGFRKAHKKPAYAWAEKVRAQYEPAKRAIRVYRWQHRPRAESISAREFRIEAEKWKNDTMHWSSVTKMIAHPSYLRIIGLGRKFRQGEIERLILEELQNEPDHWFDALVAITGDDPVGPNDDFDASVNAWLEWGRQNGIIQREDDNSTRVNSEISKTYRQ